MGEKNIVLIGMPSSGKSTVGRYISGILKKNFIDTDFLIKSRENRELKQIVNTDGLDEFLKIQQEVILGINVENSIISTGGSVIYGDRSMLHLRRNGIVFFLMVGFEELAGRITGDRRFARNSEQNFYELYTERMPLYEKYADININCTGKSVECIGAEIINTTRDVFGEVV